MQLPLLELYRDSLYCNLDKQLETRPVGWYATKRYAEVTKFRWIEHRDIAYEGSYQSAHTPLYNGCLNRDKVLLMRHNRSIFPFGVMSNREDNVLYWRNCAKTYLIKYDAELANMKEFQSLIDKWDVTEGEVPSHWIEIAQKSKESLEQAKQNFKTCRTYEKSNFGLISFKDLPNRISEEILSLTRLNAYLKRFPHNVLLAYQSVENYYFEGFKKLSMFAHTTRCDVEPALEANVEKQYLTLVSFLKERATKAVFTKNNLGVMVEATLQVDYEASMQYHLSFGKDYGSFNELSKLKHLAERYEDIVDVTAWFKHDNPAYSH